MKFRVITRPRHIYNNGRDPFPPLDLPLEYALYYDTEQDAPNPTWQYVASFEQRGQANMYAHRLMEVADQMGEREFELVNEEAI